MIDDNPYVKNLRWSESQLNIWIDQLLGQIHYFREHDIIEQLPDFSLQNFVLGKMGELCILDFEFIINKYIQQQHQLQNINSINQKNLQHFVSEKLWSLGILFLQLANLEVLIQEDQKMDDQEIKVRISNLHNYYSDEFKSFIGEILLNSSPLIRFKAFSLRKIQSFNDFNVQNDIIPRVTQSVQNLKFQQIRNKNLHSFLDNEQLTQRQLNLSQKKVENISNPNDCTQYFTEQQKQYLQLQQQKTLETEIYNYENVYMKVLQESQKQKQQLNQQNINSNSRSISSEHKNLNHIQNQQLLNNKMGKEWHSPKKPHLENKQNSQEMVRCLQLSLDNYKNRQLLQQQMKEAMLHRKNINYNYENTDRFQENNFQQAQCQNKQPLSQKEILLEIVKNIQKYQISQHLQKNQFQQSFSQKSFDSLEDQENINPNTYKYNNYDAIQESNQQNIKGEQEIISKINQNNQNNIKEDNIISFRNFPQNNDAYSIQFREDNLSNKKNEEAVYLTAEQLNQSFENLQTQIMNCSAIDSGNNENTNSSFSSSVNISQYLRENVNY